jgi:hypothetical protein
VTRGRRAGAALPPATALGAYALALPLLVISTQGVGRATAKTAVTWVDETPNAMVDDAAARVVAADSPLHGQLASLAVMAALARQADDGRVQAAFEQVAASAKVRDDVRAQAALLGRMLATDSGTEAGGLADAKLGVVRDLAILGPFRDTGGGLDAHDGPEAASASFADLGARYSWGTYEVAWRSVPPAFATANGVPLDLFVFPRTESCTWLATSLKVAARQKVVVSLAATGQARLLLDQTDIGRDEAVHSSARFDRLEARVQLEAGDHLLAAKICSGALEDDGRVRLRVTDAQGGWPNGVTASASLVQPASRGKRPAFDAVVSPLAAVLHAPKADVDEEIDTAIVRTLGGADDLRSPRAPGMLAALADAGLDPQRLAMVAWVTPNGANRSTWLNRARGDASLGAKGRAFVDRRLVERRMEAGLTDWAMATLRAAKLDQADDPEAVLLRARVEIALGTDALRLGALLRLRALAEVAPNVPSALLDTLADLAGSYDSALAAEVRKRLAQRGELGEGHVASLVHLGSASAVEAAKRAFAGGVDDADEALAVAEAIAKTGDHDAARALFEQLSRWAPNRASVWAGLAHETSAAGGDAMRDEAIAAALRRARDLEPGESRFRAELALRARKAPDDDLREDEKALTPIAVILARRWLSPGPGGEPPQSATGAPDVASHELHWARAVTMHADRRVSELVHYAREIVIAPRTEDELYEDIPAEGDLTEIVRARVHRKDGATAFAVEQASDGGHPRIRWPELSTGDVVEVAFRSWTSGPVGGRADPPFYRLDYAGSLSTHPLAYNEVSVESPVDHPIYVDVINGKPDRTESSTVNGRKFVRLIWDKPPTVPDEPLAPPLSEIVPTLVLSTFHDWAGFRSWYAEAVRGFTEPDAQVRELAAKLTRGKDSRDAKLRALFDFVADDIRYVNYVSGEWWLPNRPQQVVARREGDCDDKALLLITLLRVVGVEAQEVLVQTRLTGEPSILRAQGAAIPIFDHGIAFLPGPGGGTYLDATSPQSRLGPLPSMDARAVGLRMDGPSEIVVLPSSSPEDHGLDAHWTISIHADGGADLDGDEHGVGDDAFWMRTYLTEAGARASWVEEHLVSTWFSTVEVDKNVDFKGDLPLGAASVHWKARSGALARHEGEELVVPLSPSQTLASQLAPLVRRTLPVRLPPHLAPRKESRTIRVIAPRGWTFETLPVGGDEDGGPFGRAHLDISRDAHDPLAIVVHRTWVCDESSIGVEEYPKWRAWIQRVDALMHESVRLRPTPPGARAR